MLSICLLEADHLRPELVGEFHSYGYLFQRLFARQPIPVQVQVFNVVDGHYPPDHQRFDAYLITGSKADAFGDAPWITRLRSYLQTRYRQGDKLLGICFGHQLLALALGGDCARSPRGWGLGVQDYQVLQPEPWMLPAKSTFSLLVSHQDQVTQLPPDAQVLASSGFCPVAAFSVGQQVLAFQGHPEFVEDYAQALLDARRLAYGEELYRSASATTGFVHDGEVIAQWMLRFISQM
ncbi:amidotransferase [Pseudomonas putida]